MQLIKDKSSGYVSISLMNKGKIKTIKVHRLVASAFIDSKYRLKELVVNHINFKKDDNRLENLEVITQRENTNQKHIPSSSKYTGVRWVKDRKTWASGISVNGKYKQLGYFNDEKEASEYYESALVCVKEDRIDDIKKKVSAPELKYKGAYSSKYKGVYFSKYKQKWVARNYKNKGSYIGSFKTEDEAYIAICKANELLN